MACFWSILLLCFSLCWKPAHSFRQFPSTPFPTYCTVDPSDGVCRYPDPVPNCQFIDRIRGRCYPLQPAPTSPPPLVSPAPTEVYGPPPAALGPQVIIPTPPEEAAAAPQSPPVYGTPVDRPMPPPPPPPPFGEPQPPSVAPEFVGLPVEFPIPNQPPFPTPLEPAPSILPPSLPDVPPAVSELHINAPFPP